MSNIIIRSYPDACFMYSKRTRRSLFIEGPLAGLSQTILGDQSYHLGNDFLLQFHPDDRHDVVNDFEQVKSAVAQFDSDTNGGDITELSDAPDAFRELAAYSMQNWQICNVNLELTYRCNHRCQCCYLDSFDQPGMPAERVIELAAELKEQGALFLLLTGGEVFLRPDMMEMIPALDDLDFLLELKTNGIKLDRTMIDSLSMLHFFDIQISVYELEDGYSEFVGAQYHFNRLCSNVSDMVKSGLPVTLSVLVGKHNVDRLCEIHEKLSGLGTKIFYSPYITPNRKGAGKETDFRLTAREMEEKLVPFLQSIDGMPQQKRYRDCSSIDTVCYAGRDQIAIDPSGTIYPCLDLRIPIGSLQSELLQDILGRRRAFMSQFEMSEMTKCLQCRDRDYCDSCVGLALIENGDYRHPSSHKCDVIHAYASERR